MLRRVLIASAAAAMLLVTTFHSDDAFARRGGGGMRAGGVHHGGAVAARGHRGGAYRGRGYAGGAYRGGVYRGGAYRAGAYRAGAYRGYGYRGTATVRRGSVPRRSVPQQRGPTTAAAAATTPTATGFARTGMSGATVTAGRLGHQPENGQYSRAHCARNNWKSPRALCYRARNGPPPPAAELGGDFRAGAATLPPEARARLASRVGPFSHTGAALPVAVTLRALVGEQAVDHRLGRIFAFTVHGHHVGEYPGVAVWALMTADGRDEVVETIHLVADDAVSAGDEIATKHDMHAARVDDHRHLVGAALALDPVLDRLAVVPLIVRIGGCRQQ